MAKYQEIKDIFGANSVDKPETSPPVMCNIYNYVFLFY